MLYEGDGADRAYMLIGKVIVMMSEIDGMVTALLGAITSMGIQASRELILHAIPFNKKIELLRTISSRAPEVRRKEIKWVVDEADEIMQIRNVLAHGFLGLEGGKHFMVSLSLPKFLRVKVPKIDIEEMPEVLERLMKLREELYRLVRTCEAEGGRSGVASG